MTAQPAGGGSSGRTWPASAALSSSSTPRWPASDLTVERLQGREIVGQPRLGAERVDDLAKQRFWRQRRVARLQLEQQPRVGIVLAERLRHLERQLGLAEPAHADDSGHPRRAPAAERGRQGLNIVAAARKVRDGWAEVERRPAEHAAQLTDAGARLPLLLHKLQRDLDRQDVFRLPLLDQAEVRQLVRQPQAEGFTVGCSHRTPQPLCFLGALCGKPKRPSHSPCGPVCSSPRGGEADHDPRAGGCGPHERQRRRDGRAAEEPLSAAQEHGKGQQPVFVDEVVGNQRSAPAPSSVYLHLAGEGAV